MKDEQNLQILFSFSLLKNINVFVSYIVPN